MSAIAGGHAVVSGSDAFCASWAGAALAIASVKAARLAVPE
jgi:hypothetical protein